MVIDVQRFLDAVLGGRNHGIDVRRRIGSGRFHRNLVCIAHLIGDGNIRIGSGRIGLSQRIVDDRDAGEGFLAVGLIGSAVISLLVRCDITGSGSEVSKVKTKVAFNLTKRQIVCFAAALILGLPLFFLLKDSTGTSLASMAMIAVMLPCFLFAMYEKHGQPLEVVVRNIIRTKFIAPKERPYRTENLYAALERQRKLEKEVSAIAKGNTKKQRGGKRARKG